MFSEQAQRAAEEKAQYHKEVREHVVGITRNIGSCIYELFNRTEWAPYVAWESLGNKICDFTEFLDAN